MKSVPLNHSRVKSIVPLYMLILDSINRTGLHHGITQKWLRSWLLQLHYRVILYWQAAIMRCMCWAPCIPCILPKEICPAILLQLCFTDENAVHVVNLILSRYFCFISRSNLLINKSFIAGLSMCCYKLKWHGHLSVFFRHVYPC